MEKVCSICGGNGPFPPHGRRCQECFTAARRAAVKEWQRAHPKEFSEKKKRYLASHPEQVDRIKAYQRRYYEEHREKINARSAERQRKPEEKIKQRQRYRRKRAAIRIPAIQAVTCAVVQVPMFPVLTPETNPRSWLWFLIQCETD
jgi:cation transport ATPase